MNDNLPPISQVDQDEAQRVAARFEIFKTNFSVFHRNYLELKKILLLSSKPEIIIKLWDERNIPQMIAVLDEVIRLLHNYLASAKSLVDLTRNLVLDCYKDTDFLEEYNLEVEGRFGGNQVTGFIEGLRNYALHYRLPLAIAQLSMSRGIETGEQSFRFGFVLHKETLLNWSNWPKKAIPFLRAAADDIEVQELVDSYHKLVTDFQRWMDRRLREIHAEKLALLMEMRKQIDALEKSS